MPRRCAAATAFFQILGGSVLRVRHCRQVPESSPMSAPNVTGDGSGQRSMMSLNVRTAETIHIEAFSGKANCIEHSDTLCLVSTQGERLRQAIELAGYKKVAPFAESIGESPITVRQHINRERIPMNAVEKYVRRLASVGVTTEWLLFNKGKAPKGIAALPPARLAETRPAGVFIEVTHLVGAGDEVYPIKGDAPIGHIPSPPGYENGGAVGVRGDSQVPAFHNDDVLFYKQWEPSPSPRKLSTRPVLVELGDGRSYLKTLLPGSKAGRFHLLSVNQAAPIIRDAAVEQMAIVGWVWFGGMKQV